MTGISSGRMAIASAMPDSRLSSSVRPSHSQFNRTRDRASASAISVRLRISLAEARCRPESTSAVFASAAPMPPTAVRAPVATTTA